MEIGAGAQRVLVELDAAAGDCRLKVCQCREIGVDDRLVEHGPEALGRLKLGCVAGQVHEPDPVRHGKAWLAVPAGIVEREHDAALAPGARLLREGGEQRGEERLGDAVGEIPNRLAREGLGEGGDLQPLVAVMAKGDRALALGRPHPAQDRLQADAVLVGREHLDREVGAARRLFGNNLVELFLYAACSSGVAACG